MLPSHEELSFLYGRRKFWLCAMPKTIMTSIVKNKKQKQNKNPKGVILAMPLIHFYQKVDITEFVFTLERKYLILYRQTSGKLQIALFLTREDFSTCIIIKQGTLLSHLFVIDPCVVLSVQCIWQCISETQDLPRVKCISTSRKGLATTFSLTTNNIYLPMLCFAFCNVLCESKFTVQTRGRQYIGETQTWLLTNYFQINNDEAERGPKSAEL